MAKADMDFNASLSTEGVTAGGKVIKKEMGDIIDSAASLTPVVNNSGASFKRFGKNVDEATKILKANQAVSVNLMQQFQDVGVMMAAGQNPLMLALQQGTQVSAALGNLQGGVSPIKAISSALRAMLSPMSLASIGLIAIGGALANHFIPKIAEAFGKTKTFEESLKDVQKSQTDFANAVSSVKTPASELEIIFGGIAKHIDNSRNALLEVNKGIATRDVIALAKDSASSRILPEDAPDAAINFRIGALRELRKEYGLAGEDAEAFSNLHERLANSKSAEEVVENASLLVDFLERQLAKGKLNEEQQARYNEVMKETTQVGEEAAKVVETSRQNEIRLMNEYNPLQAKHNKLLKDKDDLTKLASQSTGEQKKVYEDMLDTVESKLKPVQRELWGMNETVIEMLGNLEDYMAKIPLTVTGIVSAFKEGMNTVGGFIQEKSNEIREGHSNAANSGLKELIFKTESYGGDYNATLDDDKYTGGPVVLVDMTIKEVRALQRRMLKHPDNRKNSSAVGAYQIVGDTLQSLIDELGLTGDELFDKDMQERLGDQLIRRRRGQGLVGYRQEWEGLKNVDDATLSKAIANAGVSAVDSGVAENQKKRADEAERAADAAEREHENRVEISEDMARQLGIAQSTNKLDEERYNKIKAINENTKLSEVEKAQEIAKVNAEYQKQLFILKEIAALKDKNIDPNSMMEGSDKTYMQNIMERAEIVGQDSLLKSAEGVDKLTNKMKGLAAVSEPIKSAFSSIFDGIVQGTMTAKEALKSLIAAIGKNLINNVGIWANGGMQGGANWAKWLFGSIGSVATGSLGFHANGGLVNTDMQIVGERGQPELVSLPKGSRVHSGQQTARMLKGMGQGQNITLQIVSDGSFKTEILNESAKNTVKIVDRNLKVYDKGSQNRIRDFQRNPYKA